MKIQVTNASTVVGAEDFANMVAACAAQLNEDFCPAWELLPVTVEFGGAEDQSAYQMRVVDTSDSPGALGYHDVDSQGKPVGFVFAKTTADDGQKVSVTLSHEMMEMVLDPMCTLWAMTPDGNLRAYEACDAVENDEYAKKVGDAEVAVSNFLAPAYFVDTKIPGAATDHLGKLGGQIAPARTPGGYDIVVDTSGNPSQEFSDHVKGMSALRREAKQSPLSRTSRRLDRAAQ